MLSRNEDVVGLGLYRRHNACSARCET